MKKTINKEKAQSTPTKGTVVIGSDHGGYDTKQSIVKALAKDGYKIIDVGSFDPESEDDYPDYAKQVANEVVGSDAKGVLVCGTGTGMIIAANRKKGARAALIYDTYSAKMARQDNNANIATIRGRKFSKREAARLVKLFLKTPFSNISRHERRIRKLDK